MDTRTENFAGHTPGPWISDEDGDVIGGGKGRIGVVVCRVFRGGRRCLANKRLIEAAPALLAERDALAGQVVILREALRCLREWVRHPGDDDSAANDMVIDRAESALAATAPKEGA